MRLNSLIVFVQGIKGEDGIPGTDGIPGLPVSPYAKLTTAYTTAINYLSWDLGA